MTFIVIDGVDGCGKSTQAKVLADRIGALHLQSPGRTRVGDHVRAFVKDPANSDTSPYADALLFAAAQAELTQKVILPHIAQGGIVVCERWTSSSLVYQGIVEKFSWKDSCWIDRIQKHAAVPDLTIVLDVPEEQAFGQVAMRAVDHPDRYDERNLEFFRTVRRGFLDLAHLRGWKLVDGTGTVEEVAEEIRKVVGQ